MKTKSFDCVKMVRDIRDKMYEEQKNLSDKDLIAYYHQKAAEARQVQEKIAHYGNKR
jgi:hypothetical protein